MTYFKAVMPNGTDFRTGRVDYGAALVSGEVVTHPLPLRDHARGYLSVSTVATDCTGMAWPWRLLLVEPVGETWVPEPDSLPNKVACHALRVVGERPAHEALGPQGVHVAALIERARSLTGQEGRDLSATWDAARSATWDAAVALVVRDLITTEQYDLLTMPWRTTIGRIHPDDAAVSA